MQLTEILLARTVWVLDIKLLNPSGLALGPIHSSLKEKYKFLVYPSTPAEFDLVKGTRYQSGEFTFEGNQIGVDFTVYNNGWCVDTLVSTEASDAFLSDLVGWLSSSFGFRAAANAVTRIGYESHLAFSSEINLTKLFDKLGAFSTLLRQFSGNPTEEVSAFVFGSDFASPNSTFPTFTFERRVSVPFSENKYFSKAVLQTKKHIQLLDNFEQMFG